MIKKIIKIDEEKCTGCGLCVNACHEKAIAIVNGKAKLVREDYCDGLGNCLPVCPTNAIGFEHKNTMENIIKNPAEKNESPVCCCPNSYTGFIDSGIKNKTENNDTPDDPAAVESQVMLQNWPIQIKLIPVNALCFQNSNLLIAADCAAYACNSFHQQFMKNRITIIGCPKLDNIDYSDKLIQIIKTNNIKSVTVVRMEVPCCSGIEKAASFAVKSSGKNIPFNVSVQKVTVARST